MCLIVKCIARQDLHKMSGIFQMMFPDASYLNILIDNIVTIPLQLSLKRPCNLWLAIWVKVIPGAVVDTSESWLAAGMVFTMHV